MRFDLVTIFPEFFHGPLDFGVVARARAAGRIEVQIHNLRDYAPLPHRITDDRPFGGGEGMVMKPEPIQGCLSALQALPPGTARRRVCLLSAQGRVFRQADARRFAALERLVLVCGRYEGVDERIARRYVDEELSIGDYVLSGGELAALAVLDATARLLPGVLGDAQSALNESFSATEGGEMMLDCPHYTRPVDFLGDGVPGVLREGNHAVIRRWRRGQALLKTRQQRPDLFGRLELDREDRRMLDEAEAAQENGGEEGRE